MPELELKQISDNLFFRPVPGADTLDIDAQKHDACSTPGNEVYVDLKKQCIITRTSMDPATECDQSPADNKPYAQEV